MKGNYLPVKISNQLSDARGNLKPGPIIKVEKFQVVKHSRENNHAQNSVAPRGKL